MSIYLFTHINHIFISDFKYQIMTNNIISYSYLFTYFCIAIHYIAYSYIIRVFSDYNNITSYSSSLFVRITVIICIVIHIYYIHSCIYHIIMNSHIYYIRSDIYHIASELFTH
eukprot:181039_1